MFMQISTIIWLFPIVFMIHDFEEILLVRSWMDRNFETASRRIPRFLQKPAAQIKDISTAEFSLSVAVEFVFFSIIAFLAAEYGRYTLFNLFAVGLVAHSLVHLGTAIWTRSLAPGVVTSVLVLIPYGLLLFPRLTALGLIDWKTILIYLPVMLAVFGFYAYGLLWVGRKLLRKK